jgi:hypothetical protein
MIQYFEEFSISFSASTSAIISAASSTNITSALLTEFESTELFLTSVGELQHTESVTSSLADRAFKHRLISKDCITIITLINEPFNFTSTTDSRYDDREFKNILVNCDAAERSTEGIEQFKALERISNDVKLNTKTAGSNIRFDIGNTLILGFVDLNIPLEIITFHIVGVNTPFLLCLNDLNRLRIYFNNLINEMIQKIPNQTTRNQNTKIRRHPVIRRYGHAFLL